MTSRQPSLLLRLTTFLVAAATFSEGMPAVAASSANLPPSWQTGPATSKGAPPPTADASTKGTTRSWYSPRFAVGGRADVPELLDIEGFAFWGSRIGLRVFYAPAVPIPLKVEIPSDVVSANKKTGLAVANPAFTVTGQLTYGQQWGAELMAFPMGGSFFIAFGASQRHLRLVADARSSVLVCSLIEAAKEPPCGDAAAAVKSRTELTAHADATMSALLVRGAIGGLWHLGRVGYLTLSLGVAKPTRLSHNVGVDVGLGTPDTPSVDLSGPLEEVRSQRRADLQGQAIKALQPIESGVLPILGLSAGLRL